MKRRSPSIFAAGLVAAAMSVSSGQAEPAYQEVEGAGGVPLTVYTDGNPENPGILFIHGFGQSLLAFTRQYESDLREKYYLVAFDMRGHGASGKPWKPEDLGPSQLWADDIQAVIEATGLKKPVLVGWSYGGYVVSDYVRHYGAESIAGANLVGSAGGLAPRMPTPDADPEMMKRLAENSARSRAIDPRANVQSSLQTAEGFYTPNMTDQEKMEQFAMGVMMPSYVRRGMGARDLDNTDMIGDMTLPVLVTMGSEDLVVSGGQLEALMDGLPNAELSMYADTGHLPFVAHPDRFNRELAAFVDRVTGH